MSFSKKIARNFVFPTIVNLGFEKLLSKQSTNNFLNIMYHGVVKKDSTYFSPRHITAQQFEKQLIYLKKNFDIIDVNEAFDRNKNKSIPNKKTITISFDDGYLNNLTTALPLIEKYEIPCTFFISSFCVENAENPILWSDIIALINYYIKEPITIDSRTFINLKEPNKNQHITDFIKQLPKEKRDKVINELYTKYDIELKLKSIDPEIWSLMNKHELQQFSKSKYVKIGSHGHLHYNLGMIDLKDAIDDMSKSKKLLEDAIEKEVNTIAYPDGNYTKEVKEEAKKIGFKHQLAVNYLLDNDNHDDCILNRHGISSTTTFESNMFFLHKAFKQKGF